MESVTLRLMDLERDLAALAGFLNKVRIQPITAERVLEWEMKLPPGGIRRTMLAQAEDGDIADTNSMENMITGVLPAYRGRKIAQALKAVALTFAKSYGADSIRTHNDSQNSPMLAINRKLGYTPQVGEYRLVRRL